MDQYYGQLVSKKNEIFVTTKKELDSLSSQQSVFKQFTSNLVNLYKNKLQNLQDPNLKVLDFAKTFVELVLIYLNSKDI